MEPKIRFKGFCGEWKETSIGNVATIVGGGTPSTYNPSYWNGDIQWFTPTEVGHEKYVYKSRRTISKEGLENSSAKKIPSSSILLTSRATIGEASINLIECTTNQGFQSLIPIDMDLDFLYSLVTTKKEELIRESSGSTFLEISANKVRSIEICIPKLDEQKAIGSYFQHLDSLIQSTTKKIESLKQVKAASLQSMFPQEGETTPRVRFKGFKGEWENEHYDKVFSFIKNNSFTREQLSYNEGEVKNVHYGDVLIKFGDILDANRDDLPYIVGLKRNSKLCQNALLQDGDIIIADAAEDYTVGKCSEIVNVKDDFILSGLHTIACHPRIKFASGYLGYFMNTDSYHNQLLPLIQGSKISSISKSAILQTRIMFPSFNEQKAIASYFTSLDTQISLQSQRLEKLKQIKSACLDNMFV